jgi:ketosteroid isomerase-like protein
MRMPTFVSTVVLALALAGVAGAQPSSLAASPPPPSPAATAPGPTETVAAFHAALEKGDRAAALELLLPGVSIFEGGEAELSRDAYAAEHLAADIEFSRATAEQVDAREAHESGDTAWVLTRTRTSGTFRGKAVRSAGDETMVLQRTAEGWRIAHVHWSSHARR